MTSFENNIGSNVRTNTSWKVIGGLMLAIALWGTYHAVGAGLTLAQKEKFFGVTSWWKPQSVVETRASAAEPDANSAKEKADFRRSLVVAVSSFAFLAFWGTMLYSRQRRLRKTN